jgi:hypothetical protein
VVDVGAAFPAFGQSPKLVQQCQGLLDDPARRLVVIAGAAPADQWPDPALAQQHAVLVVVVAPVGHDDVGLAAWATTAAANRGYRIDERDELSDVVAVAAGQCHGERDAAAVADQMVFGTGLAAVDRAGTGVGAPLFART